MYKSLYEFNREVLENSPAGIIKLDAELKVEYLNPEVFQIFQISPKDQDYYMGKRLDKLHDFNQQVFKRFSYNLQSGKAARIREILNKGKENETHLVLKGVPVYTDAKIEGTVILINDMTESIIAEKKLLKSYEMLQKATEDIIFAMASTSEMRDPYTAGHQKRVQQLALEIAKVMDAGSEQIEGIKFAGLVHDIGKISVPADILSKPGKITEMEFEVIKNHTKAGYELLRKIEFPWPIADIVHQHHERLDGSGYPKGLKKDDILLEARILAVADVVEAMNSHRPYRPSRGIEEAVEEIQKFKGKYYDPEVVDACVKVLEEKSYILDS
jgi:putative nucleotidyltransferase with HDIG domain